MPTSSIKCSFHMLAGIALMAIFAVQGVAQDSEKPTKEPVYRVGRSNNAETILASSNSSLEPLDRALDLARQGLDLIRTDIRDYTAIMVKRERINGVIKDAEFMQVKIRNRREDEGIPFSIYMKFLKPTSVKGREVIWIENHNDNKLIAHEAGLMGSITANLDPNGFLAMRGNRYPIYEAGIENLVAKLLEKGERDRKLGGAEVKFFEDTKINGRKCTLIQVKHDEQKPPLEFHICRVFIDDELRVPIRYAGYGWPKTEGAKPTLEEEYTYLNIKLNVGLTDKDFDPKNPEYNYR